MPGRLPVAISIEQRMLRVILQQNPIAQAGSLLFGVLCVYALSRYAPLSYLLAWFAVLTLLSAYRVLVIRHYRRAELEPRELVHARNHFTAGVLLTGMTWGALPWVAATDAAPAVYFCAIVMIALMAGAAMAFSLKSRFLVLFTLPQFASLIAYLVLNPVPQGPVTALALLVFYAGMYKGTRIVGDEVRGYLRLQLQSDAQRVAVEGQAASLASANAALLRRREMLEGLLRLATAEMDALKKLHRLLEFGCNSLGLRAATVAEVRNEERRVFTQHDPLQCDAAETSVLADSLCSLALRSEGTFHFANAIEAREKLDLQYAGEVAGAYIGARVHTSEGVFGTLSFRDPVARSAPFTETELEFVRLLASWIGAELAELFAQRRLRAKERQLSTLADAMPCGMAALDVHGRFVYVNRLFEAIFNAGDIPLVERNIDELLSSRNEQQLKPYVDAALNGAAQEFEHSAPDALAGEHRIYRVSLVPNEDDEGSCGCFMLMLDITQDKVLQAELELKASLDPLTRVYNRKFLEDALEQTLSDRRRRKPVYVALLDLDGFKQINDTAGHDAGDAVLRDVAAVLRDGLRKNDLLARYGGDEFVVLLHCVDEADLHETCMKMLDCVNEKQFHHAGQVFTVGMSIGATRINRGEAIHHLLVRADSAMYLAKRRGRNRVEIVSPDDSAVRIRNRGV